MSNIPSPGFDAPKDLIPIFIDQPQRYFVFLKQSDSLSLLYEKFGALIHHRRSPRKARALLRLPRALPQASRGATL